MRWRKSRSRNRNQTRSRAMPAGGRIGSNQELGIERSSIRPQGLSGDGARRLARVRVAGIIFGDGDYRALDGLFGEDPEFRGTIGGAGARRFVGFESGEQAGTIVAVSAGVPG